MEEKTGSSQMFMVVLRTIFLGICFGVLYLLGIIFIPWPPIEWVLFVSWIVIPVLLAFGICFVYNRKMFHFDSKNITNKYSFCRFLYRLIGVTCVLLIGFVLGNLDLNTYGGLRGEVLSILCNFFFYIVISSFLFVFSTTEYLFVKNGSK